MAVGKTAAVVSIVLAVAAPCLAEKPDSPGAEPRVLLRQNFPPGKYRMQQATETQQTVAPSPDLPPMTVKVTQELTSEVTVSKPDAKGIKKMVLAFSRVKMSAPGLEMDSTDPASLEKTPMGEIFKPILKTKVVMLVDEKGRTLSIKGLDAMWDEMGKTSPRMSRFTQKMKKQMGDHMMRQMLGLGNEMVPAKPVGVGAVWHVKTAQEVPIIGKATVASECELATLERTAAGRVATIRFTADLKTTGGGDMGMGGVPLKISRMDLKQAGQIVMNADTGMVSEHTVNQKGKLGMAVGGPNGQQQEIISNIVNKTKTTITRLD